MAGTLLCMQRTPGAFSAGREVVGGRFVRQKSRFTDRVTADGSSGYRAAPGRYHLYVARACPWSQRTLIIRHLKSLEDVIGVGQVAGDFQDRSPRPREQQEGFCSKSVPARMQHDHADCGGGSGGSVATIWCALSGMTGRPKAAMMT